MLSAAQDYDIGGMQLPYTLSAAANSFFAMASVSIGSNMLTSGNANLLMVHGTEMQKEVFAKNEFAGPLVRHHVPVGAAGRFQSLSDVATRAVPDGPDFQDDPLGPRYRLTRQQDVDLVGRPRADREHRAHRAGQDPRRERQAGPGHARHLAVHRAQEAWSTPRAS